MIFLLMNSYKICRWEWGTPIMILNAMNLTILNECVPEPRKNAKLIMLKKDGKPLGDRMAYRPISLLNAFAKLCEGLLRDRLVKEIDEKGGLSEH